MILIIDDEEMLCDLISTIIGDRYSTKIISDFDSISKLEIEKIEMVITDNRIGNTYTSKDVCDVFKDTMIPIVLMTGNTGIERNDSYVDYLFKPFKKQELFSVIEKHYKKEER